MDVLEKMLKEMRERPFKRFSFEFGSDWDSLIFWKPMNWRNFTLIHLTVETNGYSHWFELDFALLGLHFSFNINRRLENETNT